MLVPARIPTTATAVSSSTKLMDAGPQSWKAEIALTLQLSRTDAQLKYLTCELQLALGQERLGWLNQASLLPQGLQLQQAQLALLALAAINRQQRPLPDQQTRITLQLQSQPMLLGRRLLLLLGRSTDGTRKLQSHAAEDPQQHGTHQHLG